jgi:hypothetical protein
VLGAWEPCVVDPPPVNDVTKAVADFLYLNVIDRPDWGELKAHGVEVEIEAKLGCLIDRTKSSDSRYFLPVQSEAVLQPGAPVQFKSSMQEVRPPPHFHYMTEADNMLSTNTKQ